MKHHDGSRWYVLCLCRCVAIGWKNDKRCGILSYMRINRKVVEYANSKIKYAKI